MLFEYFFLIRKQLFEYFFLIRILLFEYFFPDKKTVI